MMVVVGRAWFVRRSLFSYISVTACSREGPRSAVNLVRASAVELEGGAVRSTLQRTRLEEACEILTHGRYAPGVTSLGSLKCISVALNIFLI